MILFFNDIWLILPESVWTIFKTRLDDMQSRQIYTSEPIEPGRRKMLMCVVLLGMFTLVGTSLTIPFYYETQSLWYKFGADKTLLRSGKMVGLLGAVLLCTQVVLAARVRILDRLVGLDRLLTLHRYNGLFLLLLGSVHLTLVLLPEGLDNLPIGKKYWPEMVGAAMLFLLSGLVAGAFARQLLGIKYTIWRKLHRPMGYLVFAMLAVHVLFVSESFARNAPGYGAYLLFGGVVVIVAGRKITTFWQNRRKGEIVVIEKLSENVTGITVKLPETRTFGYFPGQFAYLSIGSGHQAEPHPFTIASSPTDHTSLQFMIKSSGDWTGKVRSFRVGEIVSVDGPYGLFSYLARTRSQDILLIAGGIGITPLLSMLRFMSVNPVREHVTLIWCLSHSGDMFLGDELENLQKMIPNLAVHHVYTRAKHGSRRLDMDKIASLTSGCGRDARIFLCGPGPMMVRAMEDCLALGFVRKNIHYERFSL